MNLSLIKSLYIIINFYFNHKIKDNLSYILHKIKDNIIFYLHKIKNNIIYSFKIIINSYKKISKTQRKYRVLEIFIYIYYLFSSLITLVLKTDSSLFCSLSSCFLTASAIIINLTSPSFSPSSIVKLL